MPQRTHKDLSQITQTEETQVGGLLEPIRESEPSHRATRVVSIPLSQVLPDRFQSRVILPPDIKSVFFAGEMDCYQAAQALLEAAGGDPALKREVEDLTRLGESILSDNQVEPASGAWVQTPHGRSYFLLEAGERRFWSLALQAVQSGSQEEPRLQVLEQKMFSRRRQLVENLQREDLSAVDLAKAIAALILEALGKQPEEQGSLSELDYFRQVLDVTRLPHGIWPMVEKATGYSRPYCEYHLRILTLSDELLFLASIYRVEERRLRIIVAAPKADQRNLLLQAIQDQLSSDDLERVVDEKRSGGRKAKSHQAIHRQAASRVRSLVKFLHQPGIGNLDRVAGEISVSVKDPRELDAWVKTLESLAASLRKIRARRS